MLHSTNQTILADNGVQVFENSDIEKILSMYFDYEYSNGSRKHRYTAEEVCDHFDISQNELDRMIHLLSYEACHAKV